jgi:hypothetical protein
MKRILSVLLLLAALSPAQAKNDTAKNFIWAFPITNYIKPLKPGIEVVQVRIPAAVKFVPDKQIGLLRGVVKGDNIDTGKKGYGRCSLVKGAFAYFSVFMDSTASKPKAGDLIYTLIPRNTLGYISPITDCASHYITFQTVTDTAFYQPEDFLKKWTKEQHDAAAKKMLQDIHFTAGYYLKEDSAKNLPIAAGVYKDRKILDVMAVANEQDLMEFLRYVAARPRRYAGNSWRIAETFATWLLHGAPMVVPD